jgi:hypothetical protein
MSNTTTATRRNDSTRTPSARRRTLEYRTARALKSGAGRTTRAGRAR